MPFAVVRTPQAKAAVDARMTGKDREAYRDTRTIGPREHASLR